MAAASGHYDMVQVRYFSKVAAASGHYDLHGSGKICLYVDAASGHYDVHGSG